MRVSDLRDSSAVAATDLHNGYDEIAAKRVESRLGDLTEHIAEGKARLDWLEGALDQSPCPELLGLIEADLTSAEGHLSRLLLVAKKQVRGE